MKLLGISILFFLIGIMEYLPIPNLSSTLTEIIQMTSFILPIVGIIGIASVRFLNKKNWIQIPLIFLLIVAQFYPPVLRDLANRLTISVNDGLPPEETTKVIAGTHITRTKSNATFEWQLLPSAYETLVYQPNHGFKTDRSDREIVEVINENWIIMRNDIFE